MPQLPHVGALHNMVALFQQLARAGRCRLSTTHNLLDDHGRCCAGRCAPTYPVMPVPCSRRLSLLVESGLRGFQSSMLLVACVWTRRSCSAGGLAAPKLDTSAVSECCLHSSHHDWKRACDQRSDLLQPKLHLRRNANRCNIRARASMSAPHQENKPTHVRSTMYAQGMR